MRILQQTKITVRTSELIKVLKDNMAVHDEIYAEAVKNFEEKALEDLNKQYDRIKERIAGMNEDDHNVYETFQITYPQSFKNEYEVVIGMMEVATDEHIELHADQYRAFYLNEWDWANDFIAANTAYVSKSTRNFYRNG